MNFKHNLIIEIFYIVQLIIIVYLSTRSIFNSILKKSSNFPTSCKDNDFCIIYNTKWTENPELF